MRLIWITLHQTQASDLIVNPSKLFPFFHTIIKVKLCFYLVNTNCSRTFMNLRFNLDKQNKHWIKYWPDWISWAHPHQHSNSPSWCPAPCTWCLRCWGRPPCCWCVLLLVCGQHLCSAHLSPTQTITDRDRTGELGVRSKEPEYDLSQPAHAPGPEPTWKLQGLSVS